MAKRTASVLLTLIMLISFIPAAVFADEEDRNGWVKEEGCWYYYKDDERVTGWIKTGSKWYYLDPENGGRMVDWPSAYISGKWYVFNNDGSLVSKAGWITIKNHGYSFKYYVKSDGTAYATNSWKKISGKWYYFVDIGYVITEEWIPNGIEIEGKLYFFNKDGSWKYNCWHSYNGEWFYIDGDGQFVCGWKRINKKWYFFHKGKGYAMLAEEWYNEPNTDDWYYFDKSGAMVANRWVSFDGVWFYQGSNGKSVMGWLKLNKKWYYMDPDKNGCCVTDTTMTIGGKEYKFDENGVCLNP